MRAFYLFLMIALFACSKETPKKDPEKASQPPTTASPSASASAHPEHLPPLALKDVRIPKQTSTVHVQWSLAEGTAVNAEAPVKIRFKTSEGLAEIPPDQKTTGATVQQGFDVQIRPESHATEAKLVGEVGVVVCDAVDHSICLPVRRTLEVNFVIGADAAATQTLSLPLPKVKGT
ncbi:MAG: hypothetical protein U0174_14500 [Polyangiaceae bacterium]